ncbi:MAG: ECF-type sigma factor [Blastocatellia bacterium]|nr:ECF-type sigma factor [Blastocatellia bacterium]
MHSQTGEITYLLAAWRHGDAEAFSRLMTLVYDELRQLARRQLQRERGRHSSANAEAGIRPTELVHEAYLRLAQQHQMEWKDRQHFYAIAAMLMRRVLVDRARRQRAEKRGGKEAPSFLDEGRLRLELVPERAADLIALDDALISLGRIDARKAQIVELRFFGGMTVEEIADYLSMTPDAVRRQWRTAKAWLFRELSVAANR